MRIIRIPSGSFDKHRVDISSPGYTHRSEGGKTAPRGLGAPEGNQVGVEEGSIRIERALELGRIGVPLRRA